MSTETTKRKSNIAPIAVSFLAGGILGSAFLTRYIHDSNSRNFSLTREVGALADIRGNNDGATTSDEWAEVYKSFRLAYDAHLSNPAKDLTIAQKNGYLARFMVDAEKYSKIGEGIEVIAGDTFLREDSSDLAIKGSDIVQFDNESSRYVLNFPKDRWFSLIHINNRGSRESIPIPYDLAHDFMQESVDKLNNKLEASKK